MLLLQSNHNFFVDAQKVLRVAKIDNMDNMFSRDFIAKFLATRITKHCTIIVSEIFNKVKSSFGTE